MKRLLAVLGLVLAFAAPAAAQGAAKEGQLALLFDVDSTSLTYCVVNGSVKGPFSDPIRVVPTIKTAGASTTVTEFTAGSLPFTSVVVGDVLVILTPTTTDPNATTVVAVTAKASGASITVDTAINITNNTFGYYHHVCGTTDADGWFSVPAAAQRIGMTVQYDQGDVTAIVARWECKHSGAAAAPVIIYPSSTSTCGGLGFALAVDRCSAATPGVLARLEVIDDMPTFAFCRVGVAFSGADASDAGAAREKVTVKVVQR